MAVPSKAAFMLFGEHRDENGSLLQLLQHHLHIKTTVELFKQKSGPGVACYAFVDGGERVSSKKHTGLMNRFERAAPSSASALSCRDITTQCNLVFQLSEAQ